MNLSTIGKKRLIISITVLFIIISVFDILLWINAYIDAKYYFGDDERYYMRIGSLSIAMFINLGIAIIATILLFRKKKDK